MDVAALILALVAIVVFAFARVNVGLALLTASLVCQFVHLAGHTAVVN